MLLPTWLLGSLATVMLGVALVSSYRLILAPLALRPRSIAEPAHVRRQSHELAQLLMAISMVGVLAPAFKVLPASAWQVLFVCVAAWFGWQCVSDIRANGLDGLWRGHGAVHLLHCLATVYMFSNMPAGPVCTQRNGAAGYLSLAHMIAFLLGSECLWSLFRASAKSMAAAPAARCKESIACRSAMATAMAIMLLTMN